MPGVRLKPRIHDYGERHPDLLHPAGTSRGEQGPQIGDQNMSMNEPSAPAADVTSTGHGQIPQMSMRGMSASPLRAFLRTESFSARLLVAAVAVALIWANVAPAAYDGFWATNLPVRLGPFTTTLDLRDWVNSGAMTLFFLVAGLEARREFDLGDLRDRHRLILPVVAGLVGMAVPVLIYLAVNHSGNAARGWGVAMSTDTALALGVFAMAGRGLPDRIRTFVLTVFVVDDVVSLVVIAAAYSSHIRPVGVAVAVVAYTGLLVSGRLPYRNRGVVFTVLAVTVWRALLFSGIDPVVTGLAVGLATSAYTSRRGDLEEATTLVRLFREQPTPELARSATRALASTLSANARLQHDYHRVTSFVIVPLFALANAGIAISPHVLSQAVRSPITLGIFLAYVVGKPLAVTAASWVTARASRGAVRPPVGWAGILVSGTIAGVGLTVSLLIASLAFTGETLEEAKIGVLAAALGASLLSVITYRLIALLPTPVRVRALLGDEQQLRDLTAPVDRARDHVRGPIDAVVTVVEYGDFECPWTQMAAPTARELLAANADICYVWRHLPLHDVHPYAQLAAEAAEAAAAQGKFWEMHDVLLTNQERLQFENLIDYATRLGLDIAQFRDNLLRHPYASRVARDIDSADRSGVAGTPTFFINEHRHDGPQDLPVLSKVIAEARAQALAPTRAQRRQGPSDTTAAELPELLMAVSPNLGPIPAISVQQEASEAGSGDSPQRLLGGLQIRPIPRTGGRHRPGRWRRTTSSRGRAINPADSSSRAGLQYLLTPHGSATAASRPGRLPRRSLTSVSAAQRLGRCARTLLRCVRDVMPTAARPCTCGRVEWWVGRMRSASRPGSDREAPARRHRHGPRATRAPLRRALRRPRLLPVGDGLRDPEAPAQPTDVRTGLGTMPVWRPPAVSGSGRVPAPGCRSRGRGARPAGATRTGPAAAGRQG
jgi:Na+/H+ antiporter NhaA